MSSTTPGLTAADAISLISAACAVAVPITITAATDLISADTIERIRDLPSSFVASCAQVTTI
jgi:hypothetical protein